MVDARVAMVTGATRGIGRCGALNLATRGFDVVITGRTRHEGEAREGDVVIPGSLDRTAEEVRALGRRCLPVPMDIMDRTSIKAGFDVVMNEWGRVDVLVNNAPYSGPGTDAKFMDIDCETALKVIEADYVNQIHLTQLVLPRMLARRSRHDRQPRVRVCARAPARTGGRRWLEPRPLRRKGSIAPAGDHLECRVRRRRDPRLHHGARLHGHRTAQGPQPRRRVPRAFPWRPAGGCRCRDRMACRRSRCRRTAGRHGPCASRLQTSPPPPRMAAGGRLTPNGARSRCAPTDAANCFSRESVRCTGW